MRDPSSIDNPFYRLFPQSLVLPAILLATAAAVIASQAVISGAYSMTKAGHPARLPAAPAHPQHLGRRAGQIYIGAVNWALLAGVIGAVLLFAARRAWPGPTASP